jgi:hypothetical protein
MSDICPYPIAAKDDVTTTLLGIGDAAAAARSTNRVPSTAGRINSSLFFGAANGNGDATCLMTKT